MKSNYNKFPSTKIKGHEHAAVVGYNNILDTLKKEIPSGKYVITCDVYPGVRDEEILTELKKLEPSVLINMIDVFKEEKTITEQLKYILTDDRVFGKMYYGEVSDFIDMEKLEAAKQQVEKADGLVIVYGFGASLVHPGDKLVYFDMARWEIQMRYRAGMGNYKCSNYDEDPLRKNKRGFFIEWRIADKHKMSVFEDIDWLIDTNKANDPKMIPGTALRDALKQIAQQPFRTVPYFDPGVWGGQWMKEVCDLDRENPISHGALTVYRRKTPCIWNLQMLSWRFRQWIWCCISQSRCLVIRFMHASVRNSRSVLTSWTPWADRI